MIPSASSACWTLSLLDLSLLMTFHLIDQLLFVRDKEWAWSTPPFQVVLLTCPHCAGKERASLFSTLFWVQQIWCQLVLVLSLYLGNESVQIIGKALIRYLCILLPEGREAENAECGDAQWGPAICPTHLRFKHTSFTVNPLCFQACLLCERLEKWVGFSGTRRREEKEMWKVTAFCYRSKLIPHFLKSLLQG